MAGAAAVHTSYLWECQYFFSSSGSVSHRAVEIMYSMPIRPVATRSLHHERVVFESAHSTGAPSA